MNDFTKDKLETLKILVNRSVRIDPMDKTNYLMTHELHFKIQSMIDNYCDHEPDGDFHVCVDKCRKCGVIIND